MSNIGTIKLTKDLVLKWLDFENANILNASYDSCNETLNLAIESTEINVPKPLDVYTPVYIQTTDSMGRFIVQREKIND